jgi:hypothetical protein
MAMLIPDCARVSRASTSHDIHQFSKCAMTVKCALTKPRATVFCIPPFRNQFTMRISGSTKRETGIMRNVDVSRRSCAASSSSSEPALRECLDLKRVCLHLICDAAQLLARFNRFAFSSQHRLLRQQRVHFTAR